MRGRSVQFKLALPVFRLDEIRLVFLVEQEIADDKIIHFRSHEALVRIIRRAYDRFASYIETGVHQQAGARSLLETADERPVFLIGLPVHALNSC